MKHVLVFLACLSTTGLAGAENLPIQAANTATSGSNGSSTTVESRPATRAKTARLPMTPEFKADLAYCRTLAAEERKNCERETYAARQEGLYR